MKILTSWDDGDALDMRMAALLQEYKLPGIFFIPTICQLKEHQIMYLAEQFEIGGHTVTHPMDLKALTDEQAYCEIQDNKDLIEETIGREIDWFCYPRGRFNDNTIAQVKRAGFKYARTTHVGNVEETKDLYRIHPTVHVHPNRKELDNTPWYLKALEQFTMNKSRDNTYFHIWGHSWEVENYNLWGELEQLFKQLYEHRN